MSRPKLEVKKLFEIFLYSFTHEKNFLFENKIKIKFIGDLDELPVTIKLEAKLLENETKLFKQLNLNIALNYGGKQDIEQAVKKSLSTDIRNSNFKNFLYSKDLPDVDILIRTGGYKRLSNFLLWQIPYAELYFTNICWPDFNKKSFLKSLDWYSSIDRKFGKSYSVK